MSRNRNAFTLIELLVVVAIIAVLMAVVLPSLASSRLRAKQTVCAANLRTLGQATTLYLNENGGEYFRYFVQLSSPQNGRLWWFGFELNGPGSTTNRPLDKSQSPLAPYTADLDVLTLCPLFPYDDPGYYPKFAVHAATYGFNWRLGPYATNTPSRRDRYADRMANVFLFADGIQFDPNPGFNEGQYINYNSQVTNPSLGLDGYAHFRHAKQAQIVYLDGHVDGQYLSGGSFRTVAGAQCGNLTGADGTNSIYGDVIP